VTLYPEYAVALIREFDFGNFPETTKLAQFQLEIVVDFCGQLGMVAGLFKHFLGCSAE
jgi:hypothetical protein